ncbi:MAG: ribosome biogenesis GTP-binding protein YihA/YsxC [Lentimicrobiaceae bacterium]|nr:ribosome biogenesis GTP-binding protein YihA/YsxC [Lentimicrobiaceae bacterium]
MLIRLAEFICSNTTVNKCPVPQLPEYAFIGRSNVGKSSLINTITGKQGLAKTSSQPGKTQLINHFLINANWYLVDLPGYGYAHVSKTFREKWGKMSNQYLLQRQNLLTTFVLIDARIEPQPIDIQFIEWMGTHKLPFVILFTKTDKLTRSQLDTNARAYREFLLKQWEQLPMMVVTSSKTGEGKIPILDYIEETNALFKPVQREAGF